METYSFVIDRSVMRQHVHVTATSKSVRFECVSNYAVSVYELDQSDYSTFVERLGVASHGVLDACRQAVNKGDAALVQLCANRFAQTVSSTH